MSFAPAVAQAQLDTGERFGSAGHRVLVEVGGAQRREGPDGLMVVPLPYDRPRPGTVEAVPWRFSGATLGLYARARALTQGDATARVEDGGALTLDVELAWRGIVTSDDVGRAASPLVSVAVGWASRDLVFRVALGVGVPLTNAYDHEPHESRAYSLLRASQGHGDAWLGTEESVPFVLRARLEGRVDWLFVGGDLAGALMPTIPRVGRRSFYWISSDDLIAVAQLGAWIGARPIEPLAIGVRGQVVVQQGSLEWAAFGYGWRSVAYEDFVVYRGPFFLRDQLEAFVSLTTFVRAEIEDLTLEGRLYLNLDLPDGVAFDEGSTWSATLTAGWAPR
ncbi:MAG: hypothetical protein M3Y87_26505 [Myxococcota bacterium]|nr:hypothetical protein [Myxococcota bacterium]